MNTKPLLCSILLVCAFAWAALLPAQAQSGIVQFATAQSRPLAFVGEIAFGIPQRYEGEIIVPLTFNGGEWQRNSGIALRHIDSRLIERSIEITVVTAGAGGKAQAPELRLGKLAPGRYAVVYKDPDGKRHTLNDIDIPSAR